MSDEKPEGAVGPSDGEPFLERWSRRKVEVRSGVEVEPDPPSGDAARAEAPEQDSQPQAAVELPDLDSLDADSDYSAFMAQGVDDVLQRKALRKLFASPKFNVLDGLDDYCGDYTQFEALGDIVTADMQYQIERVARAAAKALEEAGQGEQPATLAATPAGGDQADDAPTEQQKEEHDGPERPA
jgi:hypothetical protein